jgi:CRP/FNR family transcriptional regulator
MNAKQVRIEPGAFARGVLSALSESEWMSLLDDTSATTIERKSRLYREGEAATHIYIVASGLLKTFKTPAADRGQIINIFGPGDVLGVEAICGRRHHTSATALARSTVLAIAADTFLREMEHRPGLARALMRVLCEESERVDELVVNLGTKKALPRVASCILLFMERQTDGHRPEPFNIPISRQEMGAYLGLSPETVSRQLKGLVTSRVIRLDHRRLTILNVDTLRSIAA